MRLGLREAIVPLHLNGYRAARGNLQLRKRVHERRQVVRVVAREREYPLHTLVKRVRVLPGVCVELSQLVALAHQPGRVLGQDLVLVIEHDAAVLEQHPIESLAIGREIAERGWRRHTAGGTASGRFAKGAEDHAARSPAKRFSTSSISSPMDSASNTRRAPAAW